MACSNLVIEQMAIKTLPSTIYNVMVAKMPRHYLISMSFSLSLSSYFLFLTMQFIFHQITIVSPVTTKELFEI